MTAYDEQELASLIGALTPAPASWVRAAQELPRTRRELHELLPRIEQDAAFRAEATRDLERALEQAGFEARRPLLDELRKRLALKGRGD
jgi:hypothetical protein